MTSYRKKSPKMFAPPLPQIKYDTPDTPNKIGLRNTSCSSYNHCRILCVTHNPKAIKRMTSLLWAWVIYVSINLNTVFKIRLILYATEVTELNLQFVFSSTVLYSQMKEEPILALCEI